MKFFNSAVLREHNSGKSYWLKIYQLLPFVDQAPVGQPATGLVAQATLPPNYQFAVQPQSSSQQLPANSTPESKAPQ